MMPDWLIADGLGIIPRYIRIGRNFASDGLARWKPYEIDQWADQQPMTRVTVLELWFSLTRQNAKAIQLLILSAYAISMPMLTE